MRLSNSKPDSLKNRKPGDRAMMITGFLLTVFPLIN